MSEAGFVRVSSNPSVVSGALTPGQATEVLGDLRAVGRHRFLVADVSMTDTDVPAFRGHRQTTDALLLAIAGRAGLPVVSFDRGLAALATRPEDVLVLQR